MYSQPQCEVENAMVSALYTPVSLTVESIAEPMELLEDELERVPSVLTVGFGISVK